MENNHRHLLELIRNGDRTALRELFEQYYPMVCSVIRRYLVDHALSEDLAQEVFVRFWEKRQVIQVDSNLKAYLRRMAVNEALAHLRKKTRYNADELPAHLPGFLAAPADQELLADDLRKAVTKAINDLPPRCRAVFQLSRFEELTYSEIAKKMDISVKTVENQMGKALKVLRNQLGSFVKPS